MRRNETDRSEDDDLALDLPELGDDELADEGVEDDPADDIEEGEPQGDPFDDAVAHDLPLDTLITTAAEEPSALGDDATGLEHLPVADGVMVDEEDRSLIGDDHEGPERDSDDDWALDGEERADDDGGAEGVQDPMAEHVEPLPPLDGTLDEDDSVRDETDELAVPSREESGLD
jgi:hypothetical protein